MREDNGESEKSRYHYWNQIGQVFPERMLDSDEVASIFREPFVSTGYRPAHLPAWYYPLSVLDVRHNELVTMWTALISLLAHVCLGTHMGWSRMEEPCGLINLSAIVIHGCSFLAHCFSHMSPRAHVIGYLFDFMGIHQGFYFIVPCYLTYILTIGSMETMALSVALLIWNTYIFTHTTQDFREQWHPWIKTGYSSHKKPRVLTFTAKSTGVYAIFWLLMNIGFLFEPAGSGSTNTHFAAIAAITAEGLCLVLRWPERLVPHSRSCLTHSCRSHALSHLFAGLCTLLLASAFWMDGLHRDFKVINHNNNNYSVTQQKIDPYYSDIHGAHPRWLAHEAEQVLRWSCFCSFAFIVARSLATARKLGADNQSKEE